MRWRVVGTVVAVGLMVIGLAIGGLIAWGGPLADLRPSEITVDSSQPDRESKGRALLQAALEAHGGQAGWRAHQTRSFRLVDVWPGWASAFSPWPGGDATVDVVQTTHSFDSRATFVGGPRDGQTWGIADWKGWTQVPGGSATRTEDPNLTFMLPTVHYFLELPLRMVEAELVRYVGRREIRGTTYEVVYATWGSWAANDEYDQYLVFIDPQTGRIAKVEYTVREMLRGARATCHLQDTRKMGGVWLAHRYVVTGAIDDDPDGDGIMHVMTVSDLGYDRDPPVVLPQ